MPSIQSTDVTGVCPISAVFHTFISKMPAVMSTMIMLLVNCSKSVLNCSCIPYACHRYSDLCLSSIQPLGLDAVHDYCLKTRYFTEISWRSLSNLGVADWLLQRVSRYSGVLILIKGPDR
uniref:Uncharacterized protein n=1 Tax=Arundo donax TaxID=35708 RepID=A0A0A9I2U2_ARUDO